MPARKPSTAGTARGGSRHACPLPPWRPPQPPRRNRWIPPPWKNLPPLPGRLTPPVSDLKYTNAFTLLVAVVLSAQATDKGVNLATAGLFAAADSPAKMVALGEERVRHFIRTIGLFNTKAKNVVALSRILLEDHGGEVPSDLEALRVLPGVGIKTASVVLNVAFGVPRIAVDTHIFRVSNRIPLAVAGTTDKMQAKLEALVPEPYLLQAHHWLILHGRYVCKARKPDCPACTIRDLCRFPDKTA